MKKITFLGVSLLLLTTLTLGACGAKKENVKKEDKQVNVNDEEAWKKEPAYGEKIKLGYNGGACLSPLGIAKEKGFYKEEGLDVEIVSTTETKDAIGTGKVDFGADHIATLLVPAVNGVEMVFTTGIHTGCKTLYTLADSGFDSTKDLVGKTIAVPDGIGNSDHNIALRFFNKDNIEPEKVKFKQVEAGATILAMEKGEIEGALLSDQFAKKFLDEGKLQSVRSLTFDDDFKNETCCVMAVNRTFYEKNPITTAKLTKAMTKSRNWVQDNKEEAVDIMFANDWGSGDKETLVEIMNTYDFSISDKHTEETLTNILNDYKKFKIVDDTKDTDQVIDYLWHPVK